MAWVRYDDQFYGHPKVTAVIAEDPGALALHVLANTWTNGQKDPGHIPVHQPGMLLCDRSLGAKWASVLVHAKLWHERGQECDECRDEYADLPPDAGGYVIHNAKQYRAPARERQTPGTPAEISAKRAAAGRKGGKATAARRGQQTDVANQANGQANQANEDGPEAVDDDPGLGVDAGGSTAAEAPARPGESTHNEQRARANAANGASKASKRASKRASPVPEPVPDPLFASIEANVPPTAGAETRPGEVVWNRQTLVADWISHCKKRPPDQVIGQIAAQISSLLDQKIDPLDIRRGLALWHDKAKHPSTLPSFVNEAMNADPRRASTNGYPGPYNESKPKNYRSGSL